MTKRKYKLTWQKGSGGRVGRWKKTLGGKSYYFDAGHGKSDTQAYKLAVDEVEKLKVTLAAQTQKPHASDYARVISEWEAVKTWSLQNEDEIHHDAAEAKLTELRRRLAKARPNALVWGDSFFDQFELPQGLVGEIQEILRSANSPFVSAYAPQQSETITHSQEIHDSFGLLPGEHQKRLWQDRIATISRQDAPESKSVASNIKRFLEHHLVRVQLKKLSAGRYDNIRRSLSEFENFAGAKKSVEELKEPVLREYYLRVQRDVVGKELSSSSGRDRVADVDQFLRWLWREGAIDELPRNLGKDQITLSAPTIETFEKVEIKKLWLKAGSKMRLYILLALNCGMTQKDISDLAPNEVNWQKGTITRKRSKTKDHSSTPLVTFKLWPETKKLLKLFRSGDKHRLLLNKYGNPLRGERVVEDGKYKKTDTIGREFARLRKQCKLTKRSFIDLKKTSRTLLESNKEYQPIAELFVGRAPSSISERHYFKPPTEWLAEATGWLRTELGVNCFLKARPASRK